MKTIFAQIFSVFCLLFSIGEMHAQVQIERQVIGNAGGDFTGSTVGVNATVGEMIVSTENATGIIYTQGFQQELVGDSSISFVFNSTDASCIGRENGFASLDSIRGCNLPYTILWSNGSRGLTANNLAPGDYQVQITSANGCESEIIKFTIGYISEEDCDLNLFTGFTPNGDGLNDQWNITNVEAFISVDVTIFNRLGNKVWEGKNYDNNTVVWKGENLSGNALPSNTYFYVVEYDGEMEKGWVELIR